MGNLHNDILVNKLFPEPPQTMRAIPMTKVKTASGESILLTDSINAPFQGMKLFGKSTQDGTPSPENPVPIVSAGDGGSITVSITGDETEPQSLIYPTPNTLPGLLALESIHGNYKDENGSFWICDEVSFARGVYVRRLLNLTGLTFQVRPNYRVGDSELFISTMSFDLDEENRKKARPLCSHLPYKLVAATNELGFYAAYSHVYARIPSVEDVETFDRLMDGARFVFVINEVEIPLTSTEISDYAALHTNYPTTTVMNDAGTGMEVGYKAMVKEYKANALRMYFKANPII